MRIPGYLIPLEFDSTSVREFLLVPYFGACIHVPPPPSNQIVYVESPEDVAISGMFDAVWVTGTLSTRSFSHEIADAGYSIEASEVRPYE